jgi:NodT family efflux transporter outer membrane factor (OMF) lipoprotein
MSAARAALFASAALAITAGCNFAPKYTRPSTPATAAYREVTPADYKSMDGWKVAQPQDDRIRGKWWQMFGDPLLNQLEDQVDASNQTLVLAYANYRAARALVAGARSQFFPTVVASPDITRQKSGSTSFRSSATSTVVRSSGTVTSYQLPASATWEIDLWGRIRNNVEALSNEAQASAGDLENTRLSLHSQLAVFYFELRGQDALRQLFDNTVAAFEKDLELVKIRHEGGIASDLDVAQAETQLKSAIASATDLGINRALFEHAIAQLAGQTASAFSIPVSPLHQDPPAIPVGVPSQLLERRPDIAAAERRVAEANANIGVAMAAFFPTLILSGDIGFASTALSSLLSAPSLFWSLGASLSQTLFDGGKRQAQLEDSRALYEGFVASYRNTVLVAFQEVEDQLATLRILSEERREQDDAVRAAQNALKVAEDRYKFGVDSYLNVITAQTTLLTNQRTATTIRELQMTASVNLVKALGGSWDISQLPSERQVRSGGRIFP